MRAIFAPITWSAPTAHTVVPGATGNRGRRQGTLDERWLFVYARANWQSLIRGNEADAFLVGSDDTQTIFLVAEDDLGMFVLRSVTSHTAGMNRDNIQARLADLIGRADFPVELVELASWQPEQRVAQRFQEGRAFLVGDAAHTMPPKEGLGANTAIQSAQNLAWKLAAVLHGYAPPALLTTYNAERRPVARFAVGHSMSGPASTLLERSSGGEKRSEFFPTVGYRYKSDAVVAEDDRPSAESNDVALLDREEMTGIPGTRLPHAWVDRHGERVSTLDLNRARFLVLPAGDGTACREAATRVAAS